jgi:hypothetical protein
MRRTTRLLLLALTIVATRGLCQKGPARYFGEPILTDSLSTLFIPTRYNEAFMSVNKMAFWGDYYANIIVYNFKTDTYKKLFDKDTFIASLRSNHYGYPNRVNDKIKNITSMWILLLVKTKDTNNSGRIDENDPTVLFAVSPDGQIIRQLTDESENVVSFDTFEKQGFVLLKIQRDSNNDKSFKTEDKEFYFRKVDLTDLRLGEAIEMK